MKKRIYLKGLNSCNQRNQNLLKLKNFISDDKLFAGIVVDDITEADEIWIWTCGFRGDVKNCTYDYVRAIAEKYLEKRIVLVGCLPGIFPKEIEQLRKELGEDRVEIIPWKTESLSLPNIMQADEIYCVPALCDDIEEYKRNHPTANVTFHDQFIKLVVSEGCNCECTYCSERKAFPSYRSFEKEHLINAVSACLENSCSSNVMLIADSLGEYGCDKRDGDDLISLIEGILKLSPDVKVALNNFNPQFVLVYLDQLKKLLMGGHIRHINMPIQSANDTVLKSMNRKYSKNDLQKIVETFRECNFEDFDTHIIIGFDGETDSEFRETVDFICDNHIRYVLASQYMQVGDVTEQMVPQHVKDERTKYCQEKCLEQGIIINCEGSEIQKRRLKNIAGIGDNNYGK